MALIPSSRSGGQSSPRRAPCGALAARFALLCSFAVGAWAQPVQFSGDGNVDGALDVADVTAINIATTTDTMASGLQLLATPAGLQSEAIAISESGTVAGSLVRWNGSTVSEAVVWTTAKNLIPIPPIPGILSTSARDVDAEGRVLIHAR